MKKLINTKSLYIKILVVYALSIIIFIYYRNKYVERELHERCCKELSLKDLTKDDSIDPIKMITCLERLLSAGIEMNDITLYITHYYSVLSDGTVCIPWDWTLE